jgi:hypothetical protein
MSGAVQRLERLTGNPQEPRGSRGHNLGTNRRSNPSATATATGEKSQVKRYFDICCEPQ